MERFKKKKPPHDFVPRARELRRDDTRAEKIAWTLLKDRRLEGYKFRRQVPIEGFIVDFYCHARKLIVELDGEIHAEQEQLERDRKRDARLHELGYTVLRFSNEFSTTTPTSSKPKFAHTWQGEARVRAGPSDDSIPALTRASRRPLPEGEGFLTSGDQHKQENQAAISPSSPLAEWLQSRLRRPGPRSQ
jgi:very-short-patch-repair endonuclease